MPRKPKLDTTRLLILIACVVFILVGLCLYRPALLFAALEFCNKNGEAITAVGTLSIAGFTLTLWRSTDKLWASGEKSLRLTQRAFVYLDGFNTEITLLDDNESNRKIELESGKDRSLWVTRFAAQPRWRNSGNSPALNMTLETNFTLVPGTLLQDFEYPYKGPTSQMFIGPQSVVDGEVLEIGGANAVINNGIEPGQMLYIWGRAGYDDIFGHRHFVKWCYRVRFHRYDGGRLRASYIQHDDYNHSD
jgi:hypothetical protein